MKYILPILAFCIIALSGKFAFDLHKEYQIKTTLQYDFAEVNRVNYGLFNLQLWKDKAIEIMQTKVKEFKISPKMYTSLEKEVDKYIDEVYEQYFSTEKLAAQINDNLKESKVPKMFLKMFAGNIEEQIDKFDIKGKLPAIAKQISKEIKKNEPQIQAYVQKEILNMVMADTESQFVERRTSIYEKYGKPDLDQTNSEIKIRLATLERAIQTKINYVLMLLAAAVLVLLLGMRFAAANISIAGMSLASVVLLLLGITLPMIDIDARLNSFKMMLLGSNIEFGEQILYFQSKSIYDVTYTLWQGSGWDLKLVGTLIFLFSIVFPILKLILSTGYLFSAKIKGNNFAKAVIFYLGKWSMADVFVVAIFMAYIGFYGIITSQLGAIGQNQNGYAIETMNYSKLSPGALFFTCYCILSIITSLIIDRISKKNDKKTMS